ncbi:MAG: cell division protein SepF [Cyanobacteria bacterium P01_E01_bin.34]
MTSLFGKLREAMGFQDPVDDYDGDYTEFDGRDYRNLYEREQSTGHGYGASSGYGTGYASDAPSDFSNCRRTSEPQEVVPAPPEWGSKARSSRTSSRDRLGGSQMSAGKVIGLPGVQQSNGEVLVVEPRAFEEMAEVIQNLRDRKTVVMNLTLMDPADAQRSVDFVAGGTYAIDGHQERIGENIFLFTPNCVSVTTPASTTQPIAPTAHESVPSVSVDERERAWPVAANG